MPSGTMRGLDVERLWRSKIKITVLGKFKRPQGGQRTRQLAIVRNEPGYVDALCGAAC
jgi:hypothetical protein